MAQVQYQAVGRRKKAIARVRLIPGDGKIIINGREIDNYFGLETLKMTVRQPLALTSLEGRCTCGQAKGEGQQREQCAGSQFLHVA